jgi:hypothetical protein
MSIDVFGDVFQALIMLGDQRSRSLGGTPYLSLAGGFVFIC